MDKEQKDLTDKIRAAIKVKLVEINAFVDDELPDYIMILVANKRSKSQIEKDLGLFLGSDTARFTHWLWDLVKNLKVSSKGKSSTTTEKKEDFKRKISPSDEDVDVLAYDLDEQERAIFDQEDETKNLSQVSFNSRTSQAPKEAELPSNVEIKYTPSLKASNKNFSQQNISQKEGKVNPAVKLNPHINMPSTIVSVEQAVNSNDEYDPNKPDFSGSVSSVICASQRNYGGPAALQANKLLLRAVHDATKSILDGQSITDFYKPTPIKILSSNKKEANLARSRNLINVKIDPRFSFNTKSEDSVNLDELSNGSNFNDVESENYIISNASQNNRTICLTSEPANLNMFDDLSTLPFNSYLAPSYSEFDEQSHSPHFIVTLDGVDLPSFKRKYSEMSDENMDIDEECIPDGDNEDENSTVPEKKQKITERCKYWPACKNSDNCTFHHPTVPCKCFPDCKYGDKCLYIHPNCKFDAFCSRKDCPFTHASKRKFSLTPVLFKARNTKSVCKFYPKCTVIKCPFLHPKLCRYGTKCRLRVCPYSHFNIPSRNQMKWKANV